MAQEWRQGEYLISTDRRRLDLAVIHGFLTTSYWAAGIPLEIVERSIEQSLSFGVYKVDNQVGFARVITDYATFAYIGDVFILEEYRGQGLSKWILITRDAHGLYRKTGFGEPKDPERYMEKVFQDIYKKDVS
jgi:GNAT superfamily N-acetyltransferase